MTPDDANPKSYEALVRAGYSTGCYTACQEGRHPCSYHEGWMDCADVASERIEELERALKVIVEDVRVSPGEKEAMVRLRAICAWCDHAEQGDVGVGVAVEAVTRLVVEAGCYVARNHPQSTSNGCTMEAQNESHPGAAITAPGLANPYRTGVDMDQSTGPVKTGTEQ